MVFWWILGCIFVDVLAKKVLHFPPEVMADVKDVLLGSSEYAVRVMGLLSFLLHCNASNLVLEDLIKMTKSGYTICIIVPTPNYGWNLSPFPRRDLRPRNCCPKDSRGRCWASISEADSPQVALVINPAAGYYYFLSDPRLHSQRQIVTAFDQNQLILLDERRQMCMNDLPRVAKWQPNGGGLDLRAWNGVLVNSEL